MIFLSLPRGSRKSQFMQDYIDYLEDKAKENKEEFVMAGYMGTKWHNDEDLKIIEELKKQIKDLKSQVKIRDNNIKSLSTERTSYKDKFESISNQFTTFMNSLTDAGVRWDTNYTKYSELSYTIKLPENESHDPDVLSRVTYERYLKVSSEYNSLTKQYTSIVNQLQEKQVHLVAAESRAKDWEQKYNDMRDRWYDALGDRKDLKNAIKAAGGFIADYSYASSTAGDNRYEIVFDSHDDLKDENENLLKRNSELETMNNVLQDKYNNLIKDRNEYVEAYKNCVINSGRYRRYYVNATNEVNKWKKMYQEVTDQYNSVLDTLENNHIAIRFGDDGSVSVESAYLGQKLSDLQNNNAKLTNQINSMEDKAGLIFSICTSALYNGYYSLQVHEGFTEIKRLANDIESGCTERPVK